MVYVKKADREKLSGKPMPALPQGVVIGDLTPDVELMQRSRNKWFQFVKVIDALPSTKVMKIDVSGADKGRVNTIRQGIKKAAIEMNYKKTLRFSYDSNLQVLNCWSNG